MRKPPHPSRFATIIALLALFATVLPANAAPPANDDFADATPIFEGIEQYGDNHEATVEPTEDSCGEAASLWWHFTAPEAGDYIAYGHSSSIDTQFTISDALDNDIGDCEDDSDYAYDAVESAISMAEDDEVWIQGDVYDEDERGLIGAGIARAWPADDDFADRSALTFRDGAPTAVRGINFDGTEGVETDEISPCGTRVYDATAWMSFTPDTSGPWMLQMMTYNSLEFAVYEGSSLADLTPINCAHDGRGAVVVQMTAGTEYAIQIQDPGGDDGEGVMRAVFAHNVRGMWQLVDDLADGDDFSTDESSSAVAFDHRRVGIAYMHNDDASGENHRLRYAERGSEGAWERTTVDTFEGSIDQVSLVELPNGEPGIAYFRDDELWWAQRAPGGAWTTTAIDDGSDLTIPEVGRKMSAAVLPDGNTGISYSAIDEDTAEGQLRFAEYDGSWSTEILVADVEGHDGGGDVEVFNHLYVAGGSVYIAYADTGANTMNLLERDGETWDSSTIRGIEALPEGHEYLGADGMPRLTMSPDGNLAIAVQDEDDGNTWIGERIGGTWEIEEIHTPRLMAAIGWHNMASLHWDHAGRKIVIWYDDNYSGQVGVSVYEDGEWHEEISTAFVGNPLSDALSGSAEVEVDHGTVVEFPDGRLGWTVAHEENGDLYWAEDKYRVCPTADTPLIDVPGPSYATEHVKCIYGLGITTGTSATTYSPYDDVTREQMAAFIARLYRQLTGDDCTGHAHPFTDVPDTSFASDDVGCIFHLGITTGTGDTTYSPADSVTREQMAAFLARLYRLVVDDSCSGGAHPFTDVPDTSFAKDDVPCIFGLKVTTGTSATLYSPYDFVTREQMAAFLGRFWLTKAKFPS